MRNRIWPALVGIIAVAGILVGINMFIDARGAGAQLDLTQGRIYTLSPGTKQVLGSLKDPITLRLFYSPQLGAAVPSYGAMADRVREMLAEYARLANGKLKLEFFNPEPYSDVEDRAMAYGLQAVPLDQNGEQVYFGLAGTNTLDDEKQIAFFKPEREGFLEYDLTRLIWDLSNPKRPVVGLMTKLPMDGDPQQMMMAMRGMGQGGQPWISLLQLRQSYDVKTVPGDAQVIDPDVQVLVVAQPQDVPVQTQYAIDQFVMRGGRLMLLVDPHSEMEAAQQAEQNQGMPGMGNASSDLPKLLDAWGISYDPKIVVGDLDAAWRVRSPNSTDRVAVVDYVAWLSLRDGISRTDPATVELNQVSVASAGMLAKKPDAQIEFTPLLSTGPKSGTFSVDKVSGIPDPAKLLAEFKPEGGPRVVAARVHGVLHSAFTGPPDLPAGVKRADNLPAFRDHTDAPANLVIVADTDLLADRFWVQVQDFFGQREVAPFADNGAFFSNVVGTLAGGDVLLGLRSRGTAQHPFTLVDNMQRAAEAQYRQTQESLQSHLDEVQKQLTALREGEGKSAQAVITPEQRNAIDAARADILTTRQKLRAVQADLRRDISTLQNELRLFCIVLVPAILTILAIILGVARNRRRARAHV